MLCVGHRLKIHSLNLRGENSGKKSYQYDVLRILQI